MALAPVAASPEGDKEGGTLFYGKERSNRFVG